MSVSVGYYVYELTNDPLMLGFVGLAEAIPAIGFSLWAGHLVDKFSRRNILVGCISVMFLCSVSLLAVSLGQAKLSTAGILVCIFSIIFFTGISRAFFSPANFAFLPQIVDRERLQNAVNWNSSTWEIASITGLGIGGLIYGFGGVTQLLDDERPLRVWHWCLCSRYNHARCLYLTTHEKAVKRNSGRTRFCVQQADTHRGYCPGFVCGVVWRRCGANPGFCQRHPPCRSGRRRHVTRSHGHWRLYYDSGTGA